PDGKEEEKSGTIHLCRCGHSNKKPYCDGSHVKAGFQG
ncbi:MAG: CDGSH iron-sulfur domain-containing protein, partial [Dysgonamonadaceae bacterium]